MGLSWAQEWATKAGSNPIPLTLQGELVTPRLIGRTRLESLRIHAVGGFTGMGESMARIAVVDDSRLARTFAASALRANGHEVKEIDPTSLFNVLEALKSYAPDLMLVDYLMPFCPGLSLIRACSEDERLMGVRILVLTAHHDEEALRLLDHFGVSRCLHKPVTPDMLATVVGQTLSEGRP